MACDYKDLYDRYKGQPIEIITKSGMKYCGIVVDSEEDSVDIIDGRARTVHIEKKNIEAVIEPRMRLNRLCDDDDCCCEEDDDNGNRHCKCDF